MFKKLPIYKIGIDDTVNGIMKMSLVDAPAVDRLYVALNEQGVHQMYSIDKHKHLVFGVALRADFLIYRYDERIGEYYNVFDKETIEKLVERFFKDGHSSDVNLMHSKDTNGIYLTKSFIKDSANGINPKGFEDIADGSWFVEYKVENEEVWEKILDGTFQGFSIEGIFNMEMVEDVSKDEIEEYINSILN